jgi:hypothetical protein
MNKYMKKETYVKPTVELISMENEGCVMTGSFTGGGQINPGARSGYGRSRGRTYGGNSSSVSDLEQLIEDILTIDK